MLELMKDGYLANDYVAIEQEVTPGVTFDGESLSVCLWLQPYRYLPSNNILTLSPAADASPVVILSLVKGRLVAKISNCIVTSTVKPRIRDWSHFCLSISQDTFLFENGTEILSQKCTFERLFDDNQPSVSLKVGNHAQTTPLSGKVADVRIYWRSLEENEVQSIATFTDYPSDFSKIEETSQGNEEILVQISDIDSAKLVAPYNPYMIIYITEKDTYEKAQLVCKNRQGLLPTVSTHGNEVIVKLIHEFILKTINSIETFWLGKDNSDNCVTGSYVSSLYNFETSPEDCNNYLINYFCIIEKGVPFKLIGFKYHIIEVYPVPYEIGAFESHDIYRLFFVANVLNIKEVTFNDDYYFTEISKTNKVIGRSQWYDIQSAEPFVEITVSGCKSNQFTCSNGDCINISSTCDLERDCTDRSDEVYCDTGLYPPFSYDARLAPSTSTKQTTKLKINFSIERIIDVNTEKNSVSMSVNLNIDWLDPRLKFRFLKVNQSTKISKTYAEQYWQPGLVIVGAIRGYKDKLSFKVNPGIMSATALKPGSNDYIESYNAVMFEGAGVMLENEHAVDISVSSVVDLFHFPFDKQTCSFTLLLVEEDISDVEWSKDQIVVIDPSISLALFTLDKFRYDQPKPKEIRITLQLSRRYGAYILNTFLPCMVLEIIGLMTHLLPINDYNDRVTVTLSCLIIIAALFTQMNSTLPKSAAPKMIDVWMFGHIVVMFVVFMVHVVVIYVHDSNERREAKKKELEDEFKPKLFVRWSKQQQLELTNVRDDNGVPRAAWKENLFQSDSAPCYTICCGQVSASGANKGGFALCTIGYTSFVVAFFFFIAV